MRAQTIDVKESLGRILCCTIFRPGGRKVLSKGHVISDDDVRLLEHEGMQQVWVTELEQGEVGEDDAVRQIATVMSCGAVEIRMAAGGRANLFATEPSCILVDDELLKQINSTASTVIATAQNFSFSQAGQRIATVKSAPFAVAQAELDALISIIQERGPLLQARPVRQPMVGVLYSDPVNGERARQLFENVARQRLEKFGVFNPLSVAVIEEEQAVARGLRQLLRARPTALLIASTTAPAGPEDVIGRAMVQIGCDLERFLAPVEPGNLLLLAFKDEIGIVSAPGCFRSIKPNVVDLVLPPLLARYRVSGWEVGALGHGGLLG
jgi:molybdenum cofactor cytidylyltransferase